jgi:MFS family permease
VAPEPSVGGLAEDVPTATARRRCIAAVIASLTLGGAALGMTGPLVTITLKGIGVSATLIGLNSAMPAVALLALLFGLPRLVGAVGAVQAIYAGLALWAVAVLLMWALPGPGAWLALRLLLSLGFCVHWIVGEAWINSAAAERSRGRVVGAYVTLSTLGFAVGPLVLSATGFAGALPFLVIAALVAAAAVPLWLMPKVASPEMPRAFGSLVGAWRTVPIAMAMAMASGFCDVAVFALFPVYGVQSGLTVDATITLLVAFLTGTALLQWPVGWLAERVERRSLATASSLLVIAAAAALPRLLGWTPALLTLMFLWGGAQIGFYTLGLVELGSKFSRSELVGANTVFALMYGIGALTGPLAGGAAMDAWGANGLPAAVAAGAAVVLLLSIPGQLLRRAAERAPRDDGP